MDIETTLAGKMKLGTIILGSATLALTLNTHDSHFNQIFPKGTRGHDEHKENYFLAATCVALILSALLVIATILTFPKRFRHWADMEIGYHILMAVMLIVAWALFVVSVNDRYTTASRMGVDSQKSYKWFLAKRCFMLIFQILNIVAYSALAVVLIRRRL